MAASIPLESAIFLTRQLVTIPETEENASSVYCQICCANKSVTTENQIITVECGHLIPCTECRDYNIEKVLRCKNCCVQITGDWIEGCSNVCPRLEETAKVSALCTICSSHLRKESRCCRSSKQMLVCKKKIRAKTVVFVQNPSIIKNPSPKDRPCSHYTLCQFCKKSIVKGHRSSTACRDCKTKVEDGQIRTQQKRTRVHFCLDTGMNQYMPPTKQKCLNALASAAEQSKQTNPQEQKSSTSPNTQYGWRFGEFQRIPVHALLG